ncbi:MAG: hypothetical protein EAZ14_12175 [Runella slithyformis]|nr:MAG: hypothetical protein EAZ46_09150 [Runella sp.]TAG18166.1 MAG: hypothetical protein EAZ38_15655 [Cytophagales bacterium]TAG37704.1 MAG: hypothetical protein EAZ32_14540 [Cytophagia bacterium]TAG52567.1 MAG: hypothetical protein EAZ29_07270 [Runella slithyformis]TAG75415.1 MAG: hypothetical protein EAZ26_00595 [Runella slithyformis]
MITLNLVFEDVLSEFVMYKMVEHFRPKYRIGNSYSDRGFGYIKKGISGFNAASVYTPFFVLTDLDKHECPVALMNKWLPTENRNQNLIFRIAVREIESWILSDREGFASFIGISIENIPTKPDLEADAKQTLINLVRKSRKRRIKEDIVPRSEYAAVGPNYNDRLMEYILENWDIGRATQNSDSLKRAINHLNKFQPIITNHKS